MSEVPTTSPARRSRGAWAVAVILSVNILLFMGIALLEHRQDSALRHVLILVSVPFNSVAGILLIPYLRRSGR